jgi:2-polyprenyl-3-methyl-5-hydroxy-6-metoxy-1,4-benzoquinol methylase
MELFSNQFLEENKSTLAEYSRKWVIDPLHQWSRQYEYPFVYSHIKNHVNNQKEGKLRILDAGSGVTFFPYYISSLSKSIEVDCCDYDISLGRIFSEINRVSNSSVNFFPADVRHLGFKNHTYDIIYCISVLEHTINYATILQQFKRILRIEGLLIVTFDISLDGLDDIPQEKAPDLVDKLEEYFHCTEYFESKKALELLNSDKMLTTRYIKQLDKNLLPWKYSRSEALKDILKFRMPKAPFRDLTCFCIVLINR